MRILISVFLLTLIAVTTQLPTGEQFRDDLSDQDPSSLNTPAEEGTNIHTDIFNTIFNSQYAKEKIRSIIDFADFKVRSFKLGLSLLSRENFYLLGRALRYFSNVAEFVATTFLPERPDGPGLLQGIFPELPIDQTLYGEETQTEDSDDSYELNKIRSYRMAPVQEGGAEQVDTKEIKKLMKKIQDNVDRLYGNH